MNTEIKFDGEAWTVRNEPDGKVARFSSEEDAMRHAFAYPGSGMNVTPGGDKEGEPEIWRPHNDPEPLVDAGKEG